MQCYTEIVPPSGVTHCVYLPFTSASAHNLAVVRTSLLQIFTCKATNHGQDVKLIHEADFSLAGTVTAIDRVKLLQTKSGGDALLLAFKDAKLSLVEWDSTHHSISTISIHFYENHDLLLCPWNPSLTDCVSRLTVDPSSRCAAYNFGVSNLAIIPFHQLGDDLALDDLDDMDEDKPEFGTKNERSLDADHDKPYAPSFVLALTRLDPNLLHPIDMSFLYEYRQPTIGILHSTSAASVNMAPERKDVVKYSVYTLDIEQHASTTLLSIPKLPNDLFCVMALPLPVGGSLLIGGNEIIHIDQGGKSSAIGVNEFAKECSAFPMADHSDYALRLEGCHLELAGGSHGEMLVTLANGALLALKFRLDGRSVSGLSLHPITLEGHDRSTAVKASSMAHLGHGRVFIGSEDSDSLVLATSKRIGQSKRQTTRVIDGDWVQDEDQAGALSDNEADDDHDDDDDDEDLYADVHANGTEADLSTGTLRIADVLPSLGPINDTAFGRVAQLKSGDDQVRSTDALPSLELAAACNRGRKGGLAFISQSIDPLVVKRLKCAHMAEAWFVKTQKKSADTISDSVIMSATSEDDSPASSLMVIQDSQLEPRRGTDFDGKTDTVAVGSLKRSGHTIQVTANDVRVYDADFGLSQIFEIVNEDSGEIAQVKCATIVEPYVVFVKDDASLSVLKADKSGELDEVEIPENVPRSGIISADLYHDQQDLFETSRYLTPNVENPDLTVLTVLTSEGTLSIHCLANLQIQVFQYAGLNFLPPLLSPEAPIPKHWKNADMIAQVMIASLGDSVDQKVYLVIRTTTGDVVLYQSFSQPDVEGAFRFLKIATQLANAFDAMSEDNEHPRRNFSQSLCRLSNVSRYAVVVVTGSSPRLVLKTAQSRPRIYRFGQKEIKHVCNFDNAICPDGMIFVDSTSHLNFAQLPTNVLYSLSEFAITKAEFQEEVRHVSYYDRTQSYLLATQSSTAFQLPQNDEWHPEWTEEKAKFLPTSTQSTLKLLSGKSRSVVSEYVLEPDERVLALKCLNLEVSDETHERKDLIVVGTGVIRGENVVTRGNIYIFDVVDVNPNPEVPESDLKLKLITQEDVRGSVSAITDVGSQGFLLAAQGQKTMVRGLKEDKTILPVAFMDMRFHVQVAKELKGTGMTILGDAFAGLWLMGYSEEPYKMQLLARDLSNPECIAADFMPSNKQLHIVSADRNGELRVLQYDPENPKTERGTTLLLRSTFDTGSYQTTMTLLPRTPTSSECLAMTATPSKDSDPEDDKGDGNSDVDEEAKMQLDPSNATYERHQIMLTSQTGGLSLLTPLSEQAYRRLSTLQNILTNQLEQPCGLNPKAFRNVETDGVGGRGIIDGEVVKRWTGLSSWHKGSLADKVGGSVWEVRADIEAVCGDGLGFW